MDNLPRLPLVLFLLAVGSLLTVPSRGDDPLTSEQRESLIEQLEVIQDVIDGKRVSTRTSAVQAFTAAAASDEAAYEFYLQCHKVLRFDKRDAKFTEYRDWRDRNEDKIRTKSHLAAMRLQLQYLVLTMRAAEGVDRDVIVPELERFIANIVANADQLTGEGMKVLRESVRRTIFAEAYGLDKSLEVEDWHLSPGEFATVYEKTVFPFIRENAPEQLADTWDRRIGLEVQFTELTQEGNDLALEKFETERLPRLYWAKANDIYQHVSETAGAAAMIRIVQAQQDHPDIAKWVASFRSLLAAPALPASGEFDEPASDSTEPGPTPSGSPPASETSL